jgi:hypothetical protein
LRRLALAFLAAFVGLGAFGLFGIKTSTLSASGGGYEMTLQYPSHDRPGQPIRWILSVRRPLGFIGPVNVAITQTWFDLLDLNDIEPQPSGTRSQGPFVVWTFDPPAGDVLRVSIDALIQLNTHFGSEATVAVLEGGRPVVSVRYRTWVAP